MKTDLTRTKIMDILFDYPNRRFHLRELSRMIDISAPAVSKSLIRLKKEGLINYKKNFLVEITANTNNEFKHLKRVNNLNRIYSSGFQEFLENEFPLSTVILFGSYSFGEDTEKSDIDIAIFSEQRIVNISPFEMKLQRKINIEFVDIRNISDKLRESIINGIVIHGMLTLDQDARV